MLWKEFWYHYALGFVVHMGLCYTRKLFQIVLYLNMPKVNWLGSDSSSLNQHQLLSHVELDFLLTSGGSLPLLATAFAEIPPHSFEHLVVSEMCWAYFTNLKIFYPKSKWSLQSEKYSSWLSQENCHDYHARASNLIWRSSEIKPSFTCLGESLLYSPGWPKRMILLSIQECIP